MASTFFCFLRCTAHTANPTPTPNHNPNSNLTTFFCLLRYIAHTSVAAPVRSGQAISSSSCGRDHHGLQMCSSRAAYVLITSCRCAHHELQMCSSRAADVLITSCECVHGKPTGSTVRLTKQLRQHSIDQLHHMHPTCKWMKLRKGRTSF